MYSTVLLPVKVRRHCWRPQLTSRGGGEDGRQSPFSEMSGRATPAVAEESSGEQLLSIAGGEPFSAADSGDPPAERLFRFLARNSFFLEILNMAQRERELEDKINFRSWETLETQTNFRHQKHVQLKPISGRQKQVQLKSIPSRRKHVQFNSISSRQNSKTRANKFHFRTSETRAIQIDFCLRKHV